MVDDLVKSYSDYLGGLVTLLLGTLIAVLGFVGKAIIKRIETNERQTRRLGGFRQNHQLRLVRVEEKVGLETIEYDPETDNE